MHKKLAKQGLSILGFPCNQFGRQSPESAEAFCAFGEQQFGVSFPLLEKVKVNGSDAHPLFVQLKREAPGILGTKAVKWNFTKFLVGRDGKVIARFGPKDHGLTLRLALEAALDKE